MKLNMALCMNLVAALSHNTCAFVSKPNARARTGASLIIRHMTSTTSKSNISRIDTLQTLLSKAGAPGSIACNQPGDLEPVSVHDGVTMKLHPHLFPIAKSKAQPDHYICALRRAFADDAMYESSTNSPWPIVETKIDGPGYRLLSLNSEQLMRRIAAEADGNDDNDSNSNAEDLISIYNEELGKGSGVVEPEFDDVYEAGSVAKLGYGASKFCLLRVGPFPDLYEEMAAQHSQKNDESSSLIAAEAANSKFTGFASTFKFYAEILNSFSNREDEGRDAARVCLRLPLPSIGMYTEDVVRVSQMAGLSKEGEDTATALNGMKDMYEKIKKHEEEDDQGKSSMTPEQLAIEDANSILDRMVFVREADRDWSGVRKELGDIYCSAGLDDMATFVDPSREA
jgi:hypothetical protein